MNWLIRSITGFFQKRPSGFTYNPLNATGTYFPSFLTGLSEAGVVVSELRAMQHSAVWDCIRTISETIAGLPFHVYKEKDGVRQRDTSHPLNALIYRRPNPYMIGFTLRDVLLTNALLYGNGYAIIEKDGFGLPTAIIPIPSQDMTVKRVNGQMVYITPAGDLLGADQMIHLVGFSWDGVIGLSPIQYQMNTLGLAIATEQFGSKFFANGASLNGVFERTGAISKEAAEAFKKQWQEFHQGVGNAHGTPMLPLGVTYKNITIPPESAQFLETRKYQRSDIAALFRCPPFVVGDHEHSTFSNLESQGRYLVQYTLASWIIRVEQEFSRKLFREDEQDQYSVKLNVDGLLRGDMAARTAYYASGRQWGYLSANDVLAMEDRPPIPGGDTYLSPKNMADGSGTAEDAEPAPKDSADKAQAQGIMAETMERLATKESRALLRAAKKHPGEALLVWAKGFYAKHEGLVARSLAAPLRLVGRTDAEAYAAEYCTEAMGLIARGVEAKNTVEELMDQLEERPLLLASRLVASTTGK